MGKKTGDAALAMALDFVRAIKKTPIVVNDSRGFYTSRVVGTYIREGHLMLMEGVPAAMIENVGRIAGMPVGPLSLNDEVAVDLAWKILKATEVDLGKDAIDPRQKALLEAMVEKQRPARPQERQGLLRLSGKGAEEIVAGPCRSADRPARSRHHRCRRTEEAAAGDSGAGNRALLRGRRADRRARGRCRLDPGFRLCAVHRRHAVLYRFHGREEFRRACAKSWRRNSARASSRMRCCSISRPRARRSTAASRRRGRKRRRSQSRSRAQRSTE